jgi:hypothetical protein
MTERAKSTLPARSTLRIRTKVRAGAGGDM